MLYLNQLSKSRFKFGKSNNPKNRIKKFLTVVPEVSIVKTWDEPDFFEKIVLKFLSKVDNIQFLGNEVFHFPDHSINLINIIEGIFKMQDTKEIITEQSISEIRKLVKKHKSQLRARLEDIIQKKDIKNITQADRALAYTILVDMDSNSFDLLDDQKFKERFGHIRNKTLLIGHKRISTISYPQNFNTFREIKDKVKQPKISLPVIQNTSADVIKSHDLNKPLILNNNKKDEAFLKVMDLSYQFILNNPDYFG